MGVVEGTCAFVYLWALAALPVTLLSNAAEMFQEAAI